MERFYNPEKISSRSSIPELYDPAIDSGSSGAESSDLNPGGAYDVDIRRLDTTGKEFAKSANTRNIRQQERVNKFMAAAKSAGKFKQNSQIKERTGAGPGDIFSPIGSVSYARKPQPSFGSPFI
jgi:hypothetical protein